MPSILKGKLLFVLALMLLIILKLYLSKPESHIRISLICTCKTVLIHKKNLN